MVTVQVHTLRSALHTKTRSIPINTIGLHMRREGGEGGRGLEKVVGGGGTGNK